MRFGNFEVLTDSNGKNCLLGGGAFGKTYKARHLFLKRIVALKVLHDRYANEPRARERFLREAQAAHELKHPNIAEVLDFGEADGSLYYAMEFCSGGDLEHYTKAAKGPIPPAVCLGFARQICKALAYAHERNFYHRDLKPPNVMLASAEGEPVLKLIDFGLVKMGVEDTEESAGLTMAGEVLGTPMFASPEQLREEEPDQRSDLFSLGMTLWYLLEGAPPVPGSALTVMAERLGHKSYDKLFSMRVPRAVRPLLSKLLEKDPAKRYQNAESVLTALEEVSAELEKEGAAGKAPAGALTPANATETVIAEAAAPGLGEVMARAASAPLDEPGTKSEPAAEEPDAPPQPEAVTKAPRLQFLKNLGHCVLGEARQAQDLATDTEIVAVRLQDGFDSTGTWPARLAGAAQTVPPRLTVDLPLVTQIHEDHPYAVCASSGTIRLVQVLQARGNLPFLEAAQVLGQVALVLDEASASNRKHDLQLNQIHLAPLVANPAESAPAYTLTSLQLDQWPPFLVCVPVRQAQAAMPGHMEEDDPSATSMMTMRNSGTDEFLSANQAFGGLIYRLITGGEPRSAMYRSKNNYRPIPNLSREGNQLLASCLEGSCNDDTLGHLLEKMMRAEKSNVVPQTSSTRSNAGALSSAAAMKSGMPAHEQPSTASSSSPLKTSPPKSSESSSGTAAAPAASTPPSLPVQQSPAPAPAPAPVSSPEPPREQVSPVKPAPPLPPPASDKGKKLQPATLPKTPASSPVPPIVWLAAGASLLVLVGVVAVGIFAYQGWLASKPDPTPSPNTPLDQPTPPVADVKKQEPPRQEPKTPTPAPPPVVEKKPEPPPPPPKPKPPKELVFTKRVFPATVRVKANGRSIQFTKNAVSQYVLDLSAFTDYPLSILISPPLGFSGESHLITDPRAATYEHEVVFKRAKSDITIQGNSDYDSAEFTFLDYHEDERASFQGDEFSKPAVGIVSLRNGSAKTEVPTGLYQIRLLSRNKNVAPRILAEKYPIPKRTGTGDLPTVPAGWGGRTFECRFEVPVEIEGKKITLFAHRVLTFDEGLGSGMLKDTWSSAGSPAERHEYKITDIKVDASGNLTALLPLEDERHKDKTFNEVVELRQTAQGVVTFQFYPAENSAKKTRKDFDVSGQAREQR